MTGAILVSACAHDPTNITLPGFQAWYEGQSVWYITTDVSDAGLAKAMGANYAPRLRDAIPDYPKPPHQKTVLERVYAFSDRSQASVFASAPEPTGFTSTNQSYSPLWLMYEVRWLPGHEPEVLRSEEAILSAEESGKVTIRRSDVVINCPVVNAPADSSHNWLRQSDW